MHPRRLLFSTSSVGLMAVALVLAFPGGAVPPAPTPVVRSPADENHATAGWNRAGTIQYVAFSRRDARTDRTNAYLRAIRRDGSRTTVKLNLSGDADVGGFFHRRRVLYAQTHKGDFDLRVYDIPTGRRTIPQGVNTRRHEWLATRSGRYLLFNRDDDERMRVVLRDMTRSRNAETVLGRARPEAAWVFAGQVSGRWTVWTRCTSSCDVFRRNIASGVTARLAKPSSVPPLNQYDASVTANGTVYLVRSGEEACASTVEFVRLGASDPVDGTVIAQLGSGRFTTETYARRNPGGRVDLFFARGSCSTFSHNVFKLRVPGS